MKYIFKQERDRKREGRQGGKKERKEARRARRKEGRKKGRIEGRKTETLQVHDMCSPYFPNSGEGLYCYSLSQLYDPADSI